MGKLMKKVQVPAVVIGNPTPERRPNRRSNYNRHALDRERHTSHLIREGVGENGLL
jgi:hypothetical protein